MGRITEDYEWKGRAVVANCILRAIRPDYCSVAQTLRLALNLSIWHFVLRKLFFDTEDARLPARQGTLAVHSAVSVLRGIVEQRTIVHPHPCFCARARTHALTYTHTPPCSHGTPHQRVNAETKAGITFHECRFNGKKWMKGKACIISLERMGLPYWKEDWAGVIHKTNETVLPEWMNEKVSLSDSWTD